MSQDLMQEYAERSAEIAGSAASVKRSVFRLMKFYIWAFAIVIVFLNFPYVIQFYHYTHDSADYYDYRYSQMDGFSGDLMRMFYVTGMLGAMSSVATGFLLYAVIREGFGKFDKDVRAGRITELKESQGASIREMTLALAADMQLPREYPIRFWKTMSTAQYPSVQQVEEGDVNIVLPVNYFLYHQQHPERSKAILAHELGHVRQRDTDLYMLSEKFYSTVRLVVVPMMCLSLFTVLLMLVLNGNNQVQDGFLPVAVSALSVIIPGAFIVFYMGQYNKIKALRQQSEHLADMNAYLYADGSRLLEVLEALQEPGRRSSIVHPPRQERIAYIQQLQNPQIIPS